jgi:hypothetical protein
VTGLSPAAWLVIDAVTRRATSALGSWTGSQTSLGPSVAGVPGLLLLFVFVLARAVDARAGAGLTIVGLVWLGVIALFIWGLGVPVLIRGFLAASQILNGPAAGIPIPGYPASLAVWLPLVLFLAELCAVLVLAPRAHDEPGDVTDPARGPAAAVPASTITKLRPLTVAAVMAALALVASLPRIAFNEPRVRSRITILDKGMVNWDVPVQGRLGLERSGMFGLLPRYLEAAGYSVRLDHDAFSQASIDRTDVLVVINPAERLTAEEHARVERFVDGGGGLLVLGDHTDIGGIMTPLNELLEPYGISYLFDSAFTPSHWRNNAGFIPGPLTRGLDDANSRFGQSTGASLRLRAGAEPVATARWGFSDAGNKENRDNAFLGDYIYQAREPLGDLPVVALCRHGRGRVLVFGDTSSFQNVSIAFSWPFIERVFLTASGRNLAAVAWLSPLALLGWCAALVALGLRGGLQLRGPALAGTWAGLLLAGLVARVAENPVPALGGPVAIIDAAHDNRVHLGLWDGESLAGLAVNLARNGLLPLVDRDGSASLLKTARVYASVAPRTGFSAAEVRRLRTFAEGGGEIVLGLGWEAKSGAGSLLAMSALDLAPVPLGPVPILRKIADPEIYKRIEEDPHFADAWPVEGVQSSDEVLYASAGYPIVVRRPMGRGGFTLIADSKFLLNRTLEQEGAAWRGNIVFLERFFTHLSKGQSVSRPAR